MNDVELLHEIGSGGFATVWRARVAGRTVAVKIAHAATDLAVQRFAREAEGMRAAGPPHVADLHDHGRLDDGRPFLVMELLDGETLEAWIARHRERPAAAAEVADVVERIIDSLAAVHRSGHVHRDLKPENVMLVGERVALLDLGLAAEVLREGLTRTGTVVGTPEYMAPERLLGDTPAGLEHAADIYALGVIVFEMVAGRLPFAGDPAQVELGHLTRRPPRIRELVPASSALEEVLLACLAKDPARRPGLEDVRRQLGAALRSPAEAITATAHAPPSTEPESQRRPVVLLCIDTVAGIARVSEVVESERGFVARQKGDRYVAVFAATAEDPAPRALAAARELTRDQGDTARAALHIASIQLRRRGETVHAIGAAVERPESWLPAWNGSIAMTDAAAAVLSHAGAAGSSEANIDRSVPFAGREADRAQIEAAISAAVSRGQPQLVTIIGEQGLGKSRLLREVAASPGTVVRVDARDGAVRLAAMFPETTAGTHLGERLRRAAALDEPLVVLVDDIQLADNALLEAIEYATLPVDDVCRLAIVVAATPRFEQGRKRWGARAAHHSRVELHPLGDADASALAAGLLAPAEFPPADALARIASWAGHNPARLVDLARTIKREGLVRQRATGGSWYLATAELDKLPRSAPDHWIAARELEAVPADAAAILRLAAVLGTFTRDELLELIDAVERDGRAVSRLDPDVVLGELAKRGVLVLRRGHWRFRSPGLQAGVYELIPPGERVHVHRVAHELWRGRRDPEMIARHAEGAGEREDAARAFLAIGDAARDAREIVRADEAYSAALALTTEPVLRERALAGRGRARWRIYRMQEALDDLSTARELANARRDSDHVLDYLLEEALALDWEHESAEAIRRVEAAAPLAAATADERLAVRFKMAYGRTRWRQEAIPDAIALLTTAAADAKRIGDRETEVAALLLLSCALAQSNDVAAAETRFAEVIDLTTRLGDRLHLCAAYGNRMFLWVAKRESERAVDDLRRAIQLARELGNPNPEFAATFNLAELLLWAGEQQEALPRARHALELAERFSDAATPFCHLLLARIHAMRDEREPARAALEALRISDDMAASALLFARALRLVVDDLDGWEELVDEARAKLVGEELIEVLYWNVRTLARRGRVQEAARQLAEIEALLAEWPIWRRNIDQLAQAIPRCGV